MRLALVSLALVAVLLASAAHAQSSTAIEIDGRVTAVQEGVPLCGILATAGWAEVAVVRRGAGAAGLPGRIRVMVQCQALWVGHRYHLSLASSRPRGDWDIFSLVGEPPSDGMPLYWSLDERELAR